MRRGSAAYSRGEYDRAAVGLARALEPQSKSPQVLYAFGVNELARGNTEQGLAYLERADRGACSVFLQYQVILWKLAVELSLPTVDAVLLFNGHDREDLFIDSAHPSARGHELIAQALYPVRKIAVSAIQHAF